MSPFAALGLEGGADARAVKRAYAQRLRAVRPDEDPEGFQRLNESYRAALAILRGEAAAADVDDAEAGGASWPAEERHDDPPVRDHRPASDAPAPPSADEGTFRLDLGRFLGELMAAAGDGGVDLRAWLDRATDGWPLQVKPLVAPHLLAALGEAVPLIAPERFAVIVEAFALDDVLGTADPLACERLRVAIERQWLHHRAVERGRALLHPENRRDLCRTMGERGYPGLLTRAVAAVVLARRAALWAAVLRWLPFTTKPVMGVLRTVTDGSYDALPPTVDARAVSRWRASERVRDRLRFRHWAGFAFVTFILVANVGRVLLPLTTQPPRQVESVDQDTSDLLHEMGLQDDSPIEDRISGYAVYVTSHPAPWTAEGEARVALAAYNRGVDLQEAGRSDDAARAYRALDQQFGPSSVHDARVYTAQGLVNLAFLDVDEGDAEGAIVAASHVLARYDGTHAPEFDLQIAMALRKRAEALLKLGRLVDAFRDCEDVLSRFGTQRFGPIASQVAQTKTLKEQVLMTSAVKARSP